MRAPEHIETLRAEGLALPQLQATDTGKGVRVALVDTGVNFQHPHLRVPGRGWRVQWLDGEVQSQPGGYADGYGHGTCCAALVHALAPEAELWAVRVTAERPTTDADRIEHGLNVAVEAGADIVCVALGTKTRLRQGLDAAVAHALEQGVVVVAADPNDGDAVVPAASPGAIAARHRDGVDVCIEDGVWWAEGRARPASAHASNFWGPSLATARVCAALARWAQSTPARGGELVRGFSKALDVR